MQAITMQPVESSQIAAIGHCAETNVLAIQFAGKAGPGSLYHYQNFDSCQFAAFAGAESVGKHFYAHIKPYVEKHPYERIELDDPAEALAAQQDAQRREDDHPAALAMNAEFDRARLQALADQHRADAHERAKDEQIAGLPAGALSVAALDSVDDLDPTDDEIIDAMVEAFGMNRAQSVERLSRFDFAAASVLEAA